MKSSHRDVLNDMAEHGSAKNNQNTLNPQFSFTLVFPAQEKNVKKRREKNENNVFFPEVRKEMKKAIFCL